MKQLLLLLLLVAGCPDDADDLVCHFPSGRPCPGGEVCLSTQGNECNYVSCTLFQGEPQLFGTAVGCAAAPVAEMPGGPFVCDPGELSIVGPTGSFTPPQGPCPLGGLWTIENGFWGRCVPTSQCLPIACDPAFGGDGCPSFHVCEPLTRTCRPS